MRMMKGLKFHKGIFSLIWVKAWRMRIKRVENLEMSRMSERQKRKMGFCREEKRDHDLSVFGGRGHALKIFPGFSFDFKGEKSLPKINKIFCSFTDAFEFTELHSEIWNKIDLDAIQVCKP